MTNDYPIKTDPRTGHIFSVQHQAALFLYDLREHIGGRKEQLAQYEVKAWLAPATVTFITQALLDAEGDPCQCPDPNCHTRMQCEPHFQPKFSTAGELTGFCGMPLTVIDSLGGLAFHVVPREREPEPELLNRMESQRIAMLQQQEREQGGASPLMAGPVGEIIREVANGLREKGFQVGEPMVEVISQTLPPQSKNRA